MTEYPRDPLVRVPFLDPKAAPVHGSRKRPRRDARDVERARKIAAKEARRDRP